MNKIIFRTTLAMLWLAALHLTIWPHIAPAGGQTVGGSFIVSDTVPPSPVNDLCVINPEENSLILTWTAPGDDGDRGTATQYDIRYSSLPITTDTEWNSANQLSNTPSPQSAGTSEMLNIADPIPDNTYYFALKTSDEIPNWSDLSNCASVASSENSGGWASPRLILNLNGQITTWLIQPNGTLLEDVYAINANGDVVIQIPAGARILDSLMNPLGSIKLASMPNPPQPLNNYDAVAAFIWSPEGSTVTPGIEIRLTYSDDMLVHITDECNLAIAIFDDSDGEWKFLNSITDLDSNTITFTLSHLGTFAMMAPSPPTSVPTSEPTPILSPSPTTQPPPIKTVVPSTPQPSQTPTTPDLSLNLNDKDFVGSEASKDQLQNKTHSSRNTIFWIVVMIFLFVTATALLLLQKTWRKRGILFGKVSSDPQ